MNDFVVSGFDLTVKDPPEFSMPAINRFLLLKKKNSKCDLLINRHCLCINPENIFK
jgi:hypothetical protein